MTVAVASNEQLNPNDFSYTLNLEQRPELAYQFDTFQELQNGRSVVQSHLKNLSWSPDGSILQATNGDCEIIVFALPEDVWHTEKQSKSLQFCARIKESAPIYDTCWSPIVNMERHLHSLFVSTKDHPIRLLDVDGHLLSTYSVYDDKDELVAPTVIKCHNGKLFAGDDTAIRIFDISRPGHDSQLVKLAPTRRSDEGVKGVVSSMAFSNDIYAVGTYNNMIGIYSQRNELMSILATPKSHGISHLKFSRDGRYLYSSSRKNGMILCWDIRNNGQVLFGMRRAASSLHRVSFDLSPWNDVLVAGDEQGDILFFDITTLSNMKTSEDFTFPEKSANLSHSFQQNSNLPEKIV